MGPFDHWPHPGGGFEYFYGFIGGETNQWNPALYEFNKPVEPDRTPEEGYHFTEDMTDKAITWIRSQKSLMGDKPFFAYFAPGRDARPAPRRPGVVGQVQGPVRPGLGPGARGDVRPPEGARGDPGRRRAHRPSTPRSRRGTTCPTSLKPVLARQMEIYAGFLEHTDHHVGRLIDALRDLEILDDTLIYYIIGDNGASAEGGIHGCFNEVAALNGAGFLETTEFMVSRIDDFGTPKAYNHYAVGWAHAMCTPVPVDQAGRLALGRHPQRHDRPLAQRHRRQGRAAPPVHPRHRRRPDRPGGGRAARADVRQRGAADPVRGVSHALRLRRRRRTGPSRDAVLRDVLQPRDLPQRLDRRDPPQHPVGSHRPAAGASTTTCGSCTPTPTGPRPTTSPPSNPNVSPSCNGSGCWRCPSTTCCRSTTGGSNGSTPTSPAGRPSCAATSKLLFSGMGRLSENSVLNLKNKSHAVTAQIDRARRRSQRRDHRPRRRLRRLEPLPRRRPPPLLLQPVRAPALHVAADTAVPAGDHQVRDGVRLRRRRARQGRHRHPVRRRQQGRRGTRRGHRADGLLRRRDLRPRRGHRLTGRRRLPRRPAFTGRIHWVQLDIGDDDKTTSSPPNNGSASPCPANERRCQMAACQTQH